MLNGPFADFKALVEMSDGDRVRVLLDIFGRSTQVEFKRSDVVAA